MSFNTLWIDVDEEAAACSAVQRLVLQRYLGLSGVSPSTPAGRLAQLLPELQALEIHAAGPRLDTFAKQLSGFQQLEELVVKQGSFPDRRGSSWQMGRWQGINDLQLSSCPALRKVHLQLYAGNTTFKRDSADLLLRDLAGCAQLQELVLEVRRTPGLAAGNAVLVSKAGLQALRQGPAGRSLRSVSLCSCPLGQLWRSSLTVEDAVLLLSEQQQAEREVAVVVQLPQQDQELQSHKDCLDMLEAMWAQAAGLKDSMTEVRQLLAAKVQRLFAAQLHSSAEGVLAQVLPGASVQGVQLGGGSSSAAFGDSKDVCSCSFADASQLVAVVQVVWGRQRLRLEVGLGGGQSRAQELLKGN